MLISRWRGFFAKSKAMSALFGLLLLTGCATVAPQSPGFRDTTVPLSVTTRGSASDLNGPWHVRASFPGPNTPALVTFIDDLNGAPAVELLQGSGAEVWRSTPLGQGRFQLNNARGQSFELWVIWVDEGFRTAAVGTPDGSYGWVLDRKPTEGEDRIIAAREVLSFNGYDTLQLIQK